jgi:hypothetical protein
MSLGENTFKVCIETNHNIEIKELLIIVTGDNVPPNICILQKTVYINGIYFMTYATYVDNITGAIQLGKTISDSRQAPLQLITMLLFEATVPIPNLNTVNITTSQQQLFVKLYKNIILKI